MYPENAGEPYLVRGEGFEPSRLAAYAPQTYVYTIPPPALCFAFKILNDGISFAGAFALRTLFCFAFVIDRFFGFAAIILR